MNQDTQPAPPGGGAPRVVFVDDDERVLRAIRRLMRRVRPEWHCDYEVAPREALELVLGQGADVVVSDMHMPEMDGATLLGRVQRDRPATARVVLSGDPSARDVLRSVPVAHQFLTKPFEAADVTQTLDRALELREILRSPTLRALVAGNNTVPSCPRTYLELNEALADGEVSMAEVAEIVGRDVSMAARLMQLASSSFFAVPRTVRTVEAVAAYLGLDTIRALVLSAEVFELFHPDARLKSFDLARLEQHSLVTARLAQRMMGGTGLEDDALMAALLHDVGLLVLATRAPEALESALRLSAEASIPLHEAERRSLGADHAEVGAYLLGLWGLPFDVVRAVWRHHEPPDPALAEHGKLDLSAAVYFANNLAASRTVDRKGEAASSADEAGRAYLSRAGLSPRASDWERMAQRLGC